MHHASYALINSVAWEKIPQETENQSKTFVVGLFTWQGLTYFVFLEHKHTQ